MNAFLGGDGQGKVSRESEVKHPTYVFVFSEENPWEIPGLTGSGCGINDNNLRIGIPPDIVDCFATYHNPLWERFKQRFCEPGICGWACGLD